MNRREFVQSLLSAAAMPMLVSRPENARYGLTDFVVVCDEVNYDVFVKPARSMEYIKLGSKVYQGNATFGELLSLDDVGQFPFCSSVLHS